MGMARNEIKTTAPLNPTNRGGRLFLCMIGLMLITVGGAFEWLMWRSYQHAKESRSWPQVEATVLRSDIDERQIQGSPREYRLNLLYGYSYGGKEITTNQFSPRGPKWTKKEDNVAQLIQEYPVGSIQTAWVNPKRPEGAILTHDTKAAGYTLWFPALFILGGLGMIYGAMRKIGR